MNPRATSTAAVVQKCWPSSSACTKTDRTIIVVTHDRDVARHADRVIVLDDGQIAEGRNHRQPRDAEAELAALAPAEEEVA